MRWPLYREGCASGDRRNVGGIGRQDTVMPIPVAPWGGMKVASHSKNSMGVRNSTVCLSGRGLET